MKYLKFLSQNCFHPNDYAQSNLIYIIANELMKTKVFADDDKKSIEIRLTGREMGSLRPMYNDYEIESVFFTIAKNYITAKIEARNEIKKDEKLYTNAKEYLYIGSELEKFHTEVIEIEEK